MRGAETVFEGIAETRDISLVNYPGRIVCLDLLSVTLRLKEISWFPYLTGIVK